MSRAGLAPLATLVAAGLAALAFPAQAQLRVRISATDPPSPATLARDEPMHIRIDYEGADRARLWVRPYHQGRQVARARTNPSRQYSGTGTALGWFSLDGAESVDEVRILAGGGSPYRETEVLRHAVEARGTGLAGERGPAAGWARELQRENDESARRERAEAAARPPSALDSAIGTGFMLAVLGVFAASVGGPLWALRRWRGGWRVAAAAPLVAMAGVAGSILLDTARDPTSHNLWPFEILMAGGAGAVFLALVALARKLLARA